VITVAVDNPWGKKFIRLTYREKCAYRAWKSAGKPDKWEMMEADSSTGHLAGEVIGYETPFSKWYAELNPEYKCQTLEDVPYWALDIQRLYNMCQMTSLDKKNTSLNKQWADMIEEVDEFPERIAIFWKYLSTFGVWFEGKNYTVKQLLHIESAPNDPPHFMRHGGVSARIIKEGLPNKCIRQIEFWDNTMATIYCHPKKKFHKGIVWVKPEDNRWDLGRYYLLGEYNGFGSRVK